MSQEDQASPGAAAWYLPEWIDSTPEFAKRGGQSRFAELAGWTRSVMSELYNRKRPYNAAVVDQASRVLDIEVYELFMHPDQARAMRQFRLAASQIASNDPPPTAPAGATAKASERISNN